MEMIKDIGLGKVKHYSVRFGMFLCPYCNEVVKRRAQNGRRDKSCGCINPSIQNHGLAKNNKRVHETWTNMKTRCTNPKYKKAHRYSKRGITICKEWYNFKKFLNWAMMNGYGDSLQIDRIDNNKGYSPDNCRFVTPAENARNKECNVVNPEIVVKIRNMCGGGMPQKKIAETFNICRESVSLIVSNKQWVE